MTDGELATLIAKLKPFASPDGVLGKLLVCAEAILRGNAEVDRGKLDKLMQSFRQRYQV